MDTMWKTFFNTTIEKTALVGSALYGGLSLWSLKDRNKELQSMSKINPIQKNSNPSLKLKPSNAYQFEGSKRLGSTGLVNPNRM